jgi:hypothetical protein
MASSGTAVASVRVSDFPFPCSILLIKIFFWEGGVNASWLKNLRAYPELSRLRLCPKYVRSIKTYLRSSKSIEIREAFGTGLLQGNGPTTVRTEVSQNLDRFLTTSFSD